MSEQPPGLLVLEAEPRHRMEALMDIFSPFWPDSVSPPLGRDNLCLLSYHGGHSPPSLLPLSLSPRVSSVLFWMCPSPVVSFSATVTSYSGGGCAMGL